MPVCSFSPESEDYEDFIIRYSQRSLDTLFPLSDPQCINIINREFAVGPHSRQSGCAFKHYALHLRILPSFTDCWIPLP